jgi:hypothetical protein
MAIGRPRVLRHRPFMLVHWTAYGSAPGALLAGVKYAEGRKAVEFEPTDSASQKLLYIYRLLVHDKIIQPLPEDQVAEATMRHKLAIWYSKQLPKDHPLLK